MSEEMNLDAMDLAELKEQARVLDISLKGNPGEDTLREKIRAVLGEGPSQPATAPAAPAGEDMNKIIIAESEQDTQPVQVAVNGRTYLIVRGEEVSVPDSVIEVLNHAKQMVYDPKTMQGREVLAYPYQIVK